MSAEDGGPPDPHTDATVARRSVRSRAPKAPVSSPPSHSGVRTSPRVPAEDTGRSPRTSRGTGSATDSAVLEAMLAEEATRAHGFSGVIAVVCASVLLALPLLAGDPVAKRLCAGALVVMFAASCWVFRATRDGSNPQRYTRAMHRGYGWVLLVGVMFAAYYCGFFSPVTVVLTLGVYYFGQSSDRSHSFLQPVIVVVTYAFLAALTAAGLLQDRGLFPAASSVEPSSHIFAVAAVNGVLLITLRMARISRRALREAIERSNEALLIAQRRAVQLAEAHHQLDHALRAAVGKPGRYTGEQAGEYRLGLVIGIGAIGEVYAGERVEDGRRVAVKLLQATALAREDLVERILREGEISRRLDSPNIVRVFDVGRMSDGAPYLAMELLQGRDLAARLRQDGQLDLPDLAVLAEQLGAGLAHAHAAGVVHRDLKPLNIFETFERGAPCWKILDFGISKFTSSSGTLTREGVIGTPGYMSPEQAKGAAVDQRSDVFSFALVLYRAMTGQPAFSGEGAPQVLFDIVYKMPKRPSSAAKGVPSDLDLVMAIALAKDPADRFQSAAEFATAFVQACRRELPSEVRARGSATSRAYPWGQTLVVPAAGGLNED